MCIYCILYCTIKIVFYLMYILNIMFNNKYGKYLLNMWLTKYQILIQYLLLVVINKHDLYLIFYVPNSLGFFFNHESRSE